MATPKLKPKLEVYEVKIPKKVRKEARGSLLKGKAVLFQGIAELRQTKITNHPFLNAPRLVARKVKHG